MIKRFTYFIQSARALTLLLILIIIGVFLYLYLTHDQTTKRKAIGKINALQTGVTSTTQALKKKISSNIPLAALAAAPKTTVPQDAPPPPPQQDEPFLEVTSSSPSADVIGPSAPFGQTITCMLINTVDSARIQTPILGHVTQDLWYGGKLLIPAGLVRVNGLAQVDKSRERIASQSQWVLSWMDGSGRELLINGIALARDKRPDGSFGIIDLSAGLPGDIIKSDKYAEIKLFAASALSAFAGGFKDTVISTSPYGTTQTNTGGFGNAAASGGQAVLQSYAATIAQEIEKEGFYVRVPAGREFYLYVEQTLDVGKAKIAASAGQGLPNQPSNFKAPR